MTHTINSTWAALAFMNAIHTEVLRQDEGSDSAYEELLEETGRDTQLIYTMAAHLLRNMPMTTTEEPSELVEVAAQIWHNRVTDSCAIRPDDAELSGMWVEAARCLQKRRQEIAEYDANRILKLQLEELRAASKNANGYVVGVFEPIARDCIRYSNYGGPDLDIVHVTPGRWIADPHAGYDAASDTPAEAFTAWYRARQLKESHGS